MALRKTFPKRLFDSFKTTLSPRPLQATVPPNASKTNFHRRAVFSQSGPMRVPEFLSIPVPVGEKLKGTNNVNLNLNLNVDPLPAPEASSSGGGDGGNGITVRDSRKIVRAWQVEMLKAKLRDIPHTSISYSQFFGICVQACQNEDQGAKFAKILDDSGNVIVLGNVVFLRPEQVAKTLENLISESMPVPGDSRWKELEQLEKQKAMIDKKAKAQVRGELYCGLGFLLAQTMGFMRLTFWELSWDVMEPICFFVTSLHLALAYIFFLRTSTEPTFQGFFQTRFKAKQKRLIKTYNLDIQRYNELCRACYPSYGSAKSQPFTHFNHA